jgi:hypothetical protein
VETPIRHGFIGDKFSKVKSGFNFLGKNPGRDVDHFSRQGVKSRTNHLKMKIMDNLWQVSEDGLSNCGGVYVFMRLCVISSNCFFPAVPILRHYVSKIENSAAMERFDKSYGAWWSKRFAYYSSCFAVKRIFSQNAVLRSRTVFSMPHA